MAGGRVCDSRARPTETVQEMSIINKMLQELDRRQGRADPEAVAVVPQVRSVSGPRKDREWFWRIIAVLMIAAVGWVAWIAWQLQPRESVATELAFKAANAPRTVAAPIQAAPVTPPAPAPVPAQQPVAPAVVSEVKPPAEPVVAAAPAKPPPPVAMQAKPAPAVVEKPAPPLTEPP